MIRILFNIVTKHLKTVSVGICCFFVIVSRVHALTLDQAINEQLKVDGLVCGKLLGGGGNVGDLTGNLRVICSRIPDTPTTSPSSAPTSNGGAPTTLPPAFQQKAREVAKLNVGTKKVNGGSSDSNLFLDKKLKFLFSVEHQILDRDVTEFANGFESSINQLLAGFDYRFSDRFSGGAVLNYSHHYGDFTNQGDFKINSFGLLGFGLYRPIDNLFLSFLGGYSYKKYNRSRITNFITENPVNIHGGLAETDFHANEFIGNALVSFKYKVEGTSFVLMPQVGAEFFYINFATYSEAGGDGLGLTFHDDTISSFKSRLGLKTIYSGLSFNEIGIVPLLTLDWLHEFENDQRDVAVSFVDDTRAKRFLFQTQSPDRDWMELNAGVTLLLQSKIQIFVNYRSMLFHSFFNSHAGMIGVRIPSSIL